VAPSVVLLMTPWISAESPPAPAVTVIVRIALGFGVGFRSIGLTQIVFLLALAEPNLSGPLIAPPGTMAKSSAHGIVEPLLFMLTVKSLTRAENPPPLEGNPPCQTTLSRDRVNELVVG